ncbi:catechol 2,3-dioxygenase-like lactoylglutathione lyase family enzyme [Crossiella equi]|uniref:Catechol 2,3-dioxygenase-like lactoylglutathione lyase family enzyme n=1 Tax=Crossiella equi TaxID=130796 RepID=A0ABS5AIP6_9PSEU|nr:VOC family protein [Crossiella equi]MBP2476453.1 catechol 2,3-dioxygenase-like lactoylglutathione lyase family enzyme [Crossiella equi]
MAVTWTLTIDCTDAPRMVAFWAAALGYDEVPLPGDPEEGGYLADPDGTGPRISLLRVPEPRREKNRLHLDLRVTGGRDRPADERTPLLRAEAARLVGLGATVFREDHWRGVLDHITLLDPEGNQFCVV